MNNFSPLITHVQHLVNKRRLLVSLKGHLLARGDIARTQHQPRVTEHRPRKRTSDDTTARDSTTTNTLEETATVVKGREYSFCLIQDSAAIASG